MTTTNALNVLLFVGLLRNAVRWNHVQWFEGAGVNVGKPALVKGSGKAFSSASWIIDEFAPRVHINKRYMWTGGSPPKLLFK